MAVLTHKTTGVRVEVSDDTADRLGDEWQPVKQPTGKATKPATK